MNHRALRSLVQQVREELRSPRATLEAFARAAFERRGLAPDAPWARSGVLRCGDVDALLSRDDLLGAVYQGLNAPALESAYRATARERRKFTPEEVSGVTGLFTPAWVAEFLVRGTLEAVWAGQPRRARDVRLLDPACGTMNVGLAAVDVLRERYRDEMDQAGRPGWPAKPSVRTEGEIGATILGHNLFGVDVDPTALWLARLTLAMKLRVDPAATPMNLTRADALFEPIPGDFDAVVTNPPYLSARKLPAATVARLKKRFPAGWRDLYACFIERCLGLCRPGGRVGLLTMQSFMFTGAFERLRGRIDELAAIESILHLGPGLFDGGNPGTLQTVAFTLRREADAGRRAAQLIRVHKLTDAPDSAAKAAVHRSGAAPRFDVRQSDLAQLPRGAWAYWASPAVRRAFATFPRLRDVAPPRQGLATTDNARFVRYWWEVEPTSPHAPLRAAPGRWFPYAKSGRFRRWYEAPRHRVNWERDGREIKSEIVRRYPYLDGDWQWVAKNATWYGKPGGVTYSYLTSGRFSARRLEPGSIFDVAGSSLFPPDPLAMLAVLNSSAAAELLAVINPTLNFQVGDLAELPTPSGGTGPLAILAAEAIELQRRLDTFDETSPDFERPAPWADAEGIEGDIRRKLAHIQRCVDRTVAELYELCPPSLLYSGEERAEAATARERAGERDRADDTRSSNDGIAAPRGCPSPQPSPRSTGGRECRADLARRWVSYAIGRILGRWGGAVPREPLVQIRPAPAALLRRVRDEIAASAGAAAVSEVEAAVGGLARFIESEFYAWHVRVFARRPVYWGFGGRGGAVLVPHDFADDGTLRHVFRTTGESLPAGWARHVDDGISVSLAPLAPFVSDPRLAEWLGKTGADLSAGRLAWSETARVVSPGSTAGSAPAPPRRGRGAGPARRRAAART